MFAVSDDGVQNGKKFTLASDNGNLFLFSFFEKALIKDFDNRVKASGGQGSHIQNGTDIGTTSTDRPLTLFVSAILVIGRNANQRSNLLAITSAKFRNIGN